MKQKIISVEATTLDDSWFQLVYNALEHGRDFKIDEGSFAGSTRKELDFVVAHIKRPFERDVVSGLPLIPKMPEGMNIPPPVTEDYLVQYSGYILGSDMAEGESYTYGQRLNKVKVEKWEADMMVANQGTIYKPYSGTPMESMILSLVKWFDQVDMACWTYKNHGHRNNQMCLQIAEPKDMTLIDPPCLRHIDTRIQDGKLHFYPYFRSWDLWSGYPANVAGISMLQEHMAQEIGVEQGEMLACSKGVHLYDYVISYANMRCMVDEKCKKA